MALGITVAGAVDQHFRGFAGDGVYPVVPAVFDGIPDKLETTLCNCII
jgi:hypothetical protein